MANIIPFKGYRYNPDIVDDLGKVMAPPYDSISPKSLAKYFELHPYNAVRLITSQADENDTDTDNKYTRAAQTLRDWIDKKILIQEEKDTIYLYEQTITVNNEQRSNRGFITLLELTDYSDGIVVPCEEPTTDSKRDRFNMIKNSHSNNSLISCMYVDRDKELESLMIEVSEDEPVIEFYLEDGIRQRLWTISDEQRIKKITDFMKDKLCYIVDGHNRYEAYLEYKKYEQENNPSYSAEDGCNYTMVQLSEAHEDGRSQLPIHRLIKFPKGFKEDYFVACAQDRFKIEKIIVDPSEDDISETMRKQIATQRRETRFALYCGDNYFYRLTLTDPDYMKTVLPDASDVYRQLDIAVLNKLILEDIFYIDEKSSSERIFYTREASEGVEAVRNGDFGCLLVVNPVRAYSVSSIAFSGEKLPKRSLCVFPKPATGIVINKF